MTTPDSQSELTASPRWGEKKPRMVFFRPDDTNFPEFIRIQFRDQERCLAQFFELSVVGQTLDYDETVDRLQPDIALFESGVYARGGRKITNTDRHPHVPKVGFLHADAYCRTRSVFLADMEDWGVETYFAHAVAAVGYTPDIADRTYAWPNFADKGVFRRYPGGKNTTVLLSGSRASNYPWRMSVDRLLRERYPVRTMEHGGWFDRDATKGMVVGKDYAKSLSRALIVPTCGTVAEEFVRKYVEIPAAGALLLAERTAAAEAAGFVDMESCVFADGSDVVEKVEYLLDNRDELEQITQMGQSLAHSKHSIEHRDQIRQWYELHRSRKAGERIIQPSVFGRLELEPSAEGERAVSVALPVGVDRIPLERGVLSLEKRSLVSAADSFAAVLDYHYEPEAALGLVRSWIGLGQTEEARQLIEHAIRGAAVHGASHPDPVEWAWGLRVDLCRGEIGRARVNAARYPALRHPELDRMRIAIGALYRDPVEIANRPRHRSVHPTVDSTPHAWIDALSEDLRASGQESIAADVGALELSQFMVSAGAKTSGAGDLPSSIANRISFTRAKSTVQMRRFAARVAGRLQREWAKRVVERRPQVDGAGFRTLQGRPIDVTVLVLVDDARADFVESSVLPFPAGANIVRLGRMTREPSATNFLPTGLRIGVEATVLDRIPDWGRSLIVTSGRGAELLAHQQVANADMIVVIDGAEVALDRYLNGDAQWQVADEDDRRQLAGGLSAPSLRAWVRRARALAEGR